MAIEEHVNVVRSGNAAIRSWRQSNPDDILKLNGAKFQDLDLSSCDFSQTQLDEAEFRGCTLRHSCFSAAALNKVKFIDCDLADANFERAVVVQAEFLNVKIEGTKFGDNATISRIAAMEYLEPQVHPSYQTNNIPFYDTYFAWNRIRFLRSINIFVPSYGILVLSVLYLNGVAAYNALVHRLNGIIVTTPELLDLHPLEPAAPSLRYLWMLAAFSMLAMAATLLFACPNRVSSYTKEQWNSELGRATLAYDISSWSRRPFRILCCLFLIAGGSIAAVLLVLAVFKQVSFIITNIAPMGG